MILKSFFTRVLNVMAALSALCILFIALSISYEVLGRYLFNRPLAWTVEISEYLQIYFVCLSAAWVLRHRGHVTLDILLDRLNPSWKKAFARASDALGFIVTTVLAVFSCVMTFEQMMLGIPVIKTLEIPKWLVILPIPAGTTLLAIEFLIKIFTDIRQRGR